MWPNPQFSMDLATFTEERFNVQLHFLRSVFNRNTEVTKMIDYESLENSQESVCDRVHLSKVERLQTAMLL